MSLSQILQEAQEFDGEKTIQINKFNVEYNNLNKDTVDITTSKVDVVKEQGYHLRRFIHDLGKTVAGYVNGSVRVTFGMKVFKTNEEYNIEIKYSHLRKEDGGKGVNPVMITADNKTSTFNVSQQAYNQLLGKSLENALKHAQQAVADLYDDPDEKYPPDQFLILMKIIFVQLKNIAETRNFTQKHQSMKE